MIGGWLRETDWVLALTALTAAAALAYAIAQVAARSARALFITIVERGPAVPLSSPLVRRPIRIVRAVVFLGMFAVLALPALDLAGVMAPGILNSTTVGVWLIERGVRIALIAILAYILIRLIAAAADRLESEIGNTDSPDMGERLKRARTLSGLVQNALTAMVVLIATLMVLNQFQIDIMPILTGAGILGLGVGFGAQTLVKDLIAGFFITFENQVRVGDIAEINGIGGLVEAINLRTIVLRDLEGTVHVFRSGSIERLANRTKDFSYFLLDVGVAYKEDVDTVFDVLREVGADLAADPAYGPSILEPLEILGVDDFGDSRVKIKMRIKTAPLKQWDIGREFRRRLKKTFDARGIEMPFPHLSLYMGRASQPLAVRQVGQPGEEPWAGKRADAGEDPTSPASGSADRRSASRWPDGS